MENLKRYRLCRLSYLVTVVVLFVCWLGPESVLGAGRELRFGQNGEFKILQVADMHFANGKTTSCLNVFPSQMRTCSDLNTTAFLERMIRAEKPNFIVFTGNPLPPTTLHFISIPKFNLIVLLL